MLRNLSYICQVSRIWVPRGFCCWIYFHHEKNYSNILTVILFEGKIARFWRFFTFTAKQPSSHRSGDCETTGKTLLSRAFHLICFPSNGNYNSKNPKTTMIRKPNPMKQKPLLSSQNPKWRRKIFHILTWCEFLFDFEGRRGDSNLPKSQMVATTTAIVTCIFSSNHQWIFIVHHHALPARIFTGSLMRLLHQ